MRKRQLPIALLVATACPLTGNAFADTVWQGSYSVDDQCFCSGDVSQTLASRIVPTPIGGQTVKQVCSQVGKGPGLHNTGGLFNHTVFKDPQCGNGPFVNLSGPRDAECVGSVDGTYAGCESAGPRWNLAAAYAAPGSPAAAVPDANPTVTEDKGKRQDVADAISELLDKHEPNLNNEAMSSIDIVTEFANNNSTDATDSANPEELNSNSVMLGDDRFLRARADLPAQGGAPGTRIILDGFVYLKDDGTLTSEDLYQEEQALDLAAANSVVAVDTDEVSVARKKQQELQAIRERAQAEVEKQASVARALEEKNRLELSSASKKGMLAKQKVLAEQQVLAEQKAIAEREALAAKNAVIEQTALEAGRKLAERQALEKQRVLAEQKVIAEQKQLALRQAAADRTKTDQDLLPGLSAAKPSAAQPSAAKPLAAKPSVTEQSTAKQSVTAASDAVRASASDTGSGTESAVITALRLPIHARASSRNFSYVEVSPTNYDIGGNGLMLEGSAQGRSRFQFVGRLGVTDTFREFMVGGGYYVTPARATRMTLVLLAGIENGSFELSDEARAPGLTVTSEDTGFYLGALSRFVVNDKFELKGGLGYSSFFEGDATFIGGGYYHITPRLDVMSRFEVGDNDSLGIGIRYYY